jgi:hypothetical protein
MQMLTSARARNMMGGAGGAGRGAGAGRDAGQ